MGFGVHRVKNRANSRGHIYYKQLQAINENWQEELTLGRFTWIQKHFKNEYRIIAMRFLCGFWGTYTCTSDIPQNLGYFLQPRAIRSLLVYLGQKIISPSKFMLPGGCFLSSNFEMSYAQKCQPENGMLCNWLQVWEAFNKSFRKNGAYY